MFAQGLPLAMAIALASGCAARTDDWAAASPGPADTAWLEGVWAGTEWESSAHIFQGVHDVVVTFSGDGAWAAVDKNARRSSGYVRVENGLVILDRWTGESMPVRCSLAVSPDRRHLFASILTVFGGRRAPATLSLERVPDRP
jgi:hypothetical protein